MLICNKFKRLQKVVSLQKNQQGYMSHSITTPTLVIDRGNTSTKAAVYRGDESVAISVGNDPENTVADIMARAGRGIRHAIYCTVGQGGEEAMSFVRNLVPQVLSVGDDIDLGVEVPAVYRSTLGSDRIAAAAGARALYPGCPLLVVDSGTAVTYDVVTPEGVFLGGNIAPGLQTGLDALHSHTALLPQISIPGKTDGSLLGHDTATAMINGVVYGVVGAIEAMSRRLGSDTRVVVTGGNSALLMPLLECNAERHPDLVLDGLNHILRINL